MMFGLYVICVSFSLVLSDPSNYIDNVDYTRYLSAPRNLMKKSEPLVLNYYNENGDLAEINTFSDTSNIIKLPTVPAASGDFMAFDERMPIGAPLDYAARQNIPLPIIWGNQLLQTPYEAEQVPYYTAGESMGTGAMKENIDFNEDGLYPYVHSSVSSALKFGPLNSLPPVYSTHIHETIPFLESRSNYDMDILNSEDLELLPANVRSTRSRSYDDFLAELSHDAMMNNILPTMSVPFVRGAEYSPYQASPSQNRPLFAMYANSPSNKCSIPILLGCSPQIQRGIMSASYPEPQRYVQPAVPAPAYREQMPQTNKSLLRMDNILTTKLNDILKGTKAEQKSLRM